MEPTSIRCELDVDPFDAPMDARVYVEYRNNSDRPVSAVKFRLRFVDAQNRDRGTFHAVDMAPVSPGGQHGLKAKRDFTLHPAVIAVKARVLQVKYGDGSDWVSTKMQELAQPAGAGGGAAGYTGGGMGAGDGEGSGLASPPPQPQAPAQSQYTPPAQSQYAPQAQAPAQPKSAAPWSVNPKEYENPVTPPPQAPAGTGLSAGADVVDSFQAPAQAPVQSAPAAAANPPQAAPAAPAAGLVADTAAPSTAPAAAPAAAPPTAPPVNRYQGAQPVNVPYSPEMDK
ncbi:MAG: hypothetical protein JST01_17400 [Cyanobacteria bacterium SZAS TMP-1]|nr:hypothetical protein [Cyanobacteria bacterium SZAS TMP-1]